MALITSAEMAIVLANVSGAPFVALKSNQWKGKKRVQMATVALASQADGTTAHLFRIPKRARLLGFIGVTDTSLGSAAIAIGNIHSGNSAAYKASAAFTATDTPTLWGKMAAMGLDLDGVTCYDYADAVSSAYMDIIATFAGAALPSSGTLKVFCLYVVE